MKHHIVCQEKTYILCCQRCSATIVPDTAVTIGEYIKLAKKFRANHAYCIKVKP